MIVSSLLRLAERESGFGTVIAKGDANAGAIIIVLAERGRRVRVMERLLKPDGDYAWGDLDRGGPERSRPRQVPSRRRGFDTDLWIVELDTASAERFAAEIIALD
jgi:hypothetical protein